MSKNRYKMGRPVTPFWEMKEFWINVIAIATMILAYYGYGQVITPEVTVVVLTLINAAIRMILGKPIVWQYDDV